MNICRCCVRTSHGRCVPRAFASRARCCACRLPNCWKRCAIRQDGPPPDLDVDADPERLELDLKIDGASVTLPPEGLAAAQSLLQDLGEITPDLLVPAGPAEWKGDGKAGGGKPGTLETHADALFDEWDYRRRAYRRQWCHVYLHQVGGGDTAYVPAVRARHAPLIRQLRRRFEAMRGEDRVLRRQADGQEVDMDALVAAIADRRGGAEPSPRLFCRRQRDERSLAAVFLVDMSGSTQGWVNDAEREALVLLCEALEMLDDRYAIWGFSGWTRTRCDLYRIKDFDEAYGAEVQARIAAIQPRDYTRMGPPIRFVTQRLLAEPARHRLLVTISDGRPDDFGDDYRSDYGIEDTRQALLEARRAGVRPFCITIDRDRRRLPETHVRPRRLRRARRSAQAAAEGGGDLSQADDLKRRGLRLWGIADHRLLSGGYEPRQLGSLGVKSCGRSTAKPPVLGTDQAISEIGGRILPDEQSFLDGRFILELNIGRIEQARDGLNHQILWQAVSAAQYPFGFHDNQMTYENATPGCELTLDQFACLLELGFVIPNQKANEYVGIDPQHHRDSCSTGTGLRPFLCNVPASSATLLDFNRMTTVASGIKVNVIRSPAFMERLSRISLGIVVWPLLVSVASFDMGSSNFLTFIIIVRKSIAGNRVTTGYLNDFDSMVVPAGRSSPNRTSQFHQM
jgi:Mg-chelatase subunit ChlD